ncbi:MAG: MlaE family ABC transporter permease [Opitutaceae bacterium]
MSESPSMLPSSSGGNAHAAARVEENTLIIDAGGRWKLRASQPSAAELWDCAGDAAVRAVRVEARDLDSWDSSLLLFVMQIRTIAAERGLAFELRDLPAVFGEWLDRLGAADARMEAAEKKTDRFPFTHGVGHWTHARADAARTMLDFLGECVLGFARVLGGSRDFRWREALEQMRRCGAQALGIVGLITFLVGVILAFVGATQFRQVGADIFVADLIGLAMFREMGPMMAAIVLAGRTGAAFAAELGNMRLNEEIDALETFGVRAHDFLVMPRLVALVLMMPLLALYADFLGVAGGVIVSQATLDIAPASFFARLREAVHLNDVATGLFKSLFFGMIVAWSGCLKGINANRSALGVGEAATAAVVLAILLIIITDAIFTVVFNTLGW